MGFSRKLLVTGAASALFVGGSVAMASSASAAQSDHASPDNGSVHTMTTTVVTWVDANIRDEPTTDTTIDRRVAAGASEQANCWVFGQEVTDHGVTNDKWVELDAGWFDDEYIWAGALQGDETGNVPNQC